MQLPKSWLPSATTFHFSFELNLNFDFPSDLLSLLDGLCHFTDRAACTGRACRVCGPFQRVEQSLIRRSRLYDQFSLPIDCQHLGATTQLESPQMCPRIAVKIRERQGALGPDQCRIPSFHCGSPATNALIMCEFAYECLCNFGKIELSVLPVVPNPVRHLTFVHTPSFLLCRPTTQPFPPTRLTPKQFNPPNKKREIPKLELDQQLAPLSA